MIQRYASGALTNIATHGLEVTQLSEEGLAAVKLRIETKEAEERTRRYAVQVRVRVRVRVSNTAAITMACTEGRSTLDLFGEE